jgi:hypothetical protein
VTSPLLKINNDVSALEGTKPRSCNFELNHEYQALGACFKPYKSLSSLSTSHRQIFGDEHQEKREDVKSI